MSFLIVDDHPIVRQGIISILRMHNITDQILEAGSLKESTKILQTNSIDIILIDLRLGHENGFDLVRIVKRQYPAIKILIITASNNVHDFEEAMTLNVDGYLLKEEFIEDILYAITVLKRGGKFISNSYLQKMQNTQETDELKTLTAREHDVFSLMQEGMSNVQIAEQLFISQATVKKHISNVLSKLSLKNRVEVILYAKDIGFDIERRQHGKI